MRECCECFPGSGDSFQGVERRFVDLLTPFRSFAFYHAAQKGSASIKSVLPALGGETYDNLEIGDGGAASREFVRVTFKDVPDVERQRVRGSLEKYCSLDTHGMIVLVDALRRLTEVN